MEQNPVVVNVDDEGKRLDENKADQTDKALRFDRKPEKARKKQPLWCLPYFYFNFQRSLT